MYGTRGEYNHPTSSPQTPTPLGSCTMGCCINTATHFSSICTAAARNQDPAISFRFSVPNPLLQLVFANAMPATVTNLSDSSSESYHHHHWHDRPGTKPKVAWFRVFGPQPFPPFVFADCHPFKRDFERDTPSNIAIWHGRPGTKPKWLGFGFSALNAFPPLVFASVTVATKRDKWPPPSTITNLPAPPYPTLISSQRCNLVQHTLQMFTCLTQRLTLPITDQKRTGRCWMFTSMNVLRYEIMKKRKLKEFQLSQVCISECVIIRVFY